MSSSRTVYHGGDKDVPEMRQYRPDAVPVETRLLPATSRFTTVFDSLPGYSRWVPVVLHFKTTGDMSRFHTVHPGSPRLSKVPLRLWHGSSRFIPDHQTGMNRHLKPGQWERGLSKQYWPLFHLGLHCVIKSQWTRRHTCVCLSGAG